MIECIDGRYFVAMWLVPIDEAIDYLCAVYRDCPSGPWHILSRVAIDLSDGEREKRWMRAQAPSSWTEAEVEEKIDVICQEMARGAGSEVDKLPFHSDRADENTDALLLKGWAHVVPNSAGGDA